jgi:hypothetical protein
MPAFAGMTRKAQANMITLSLRSRHENILYDVPLASALLRDRHCLWRVRFE